MKFEVRSAKNGYIVTVDDDDEIVCQTTHEDEIEAFAEFLFELLENYGPPTSRYSPKRIYITVQPGDKYEDIHEKQASESVAAD
jgi:hypothetical protein